MSCPVWQHASCPALEQLQRGLFDEPDDVAAGSPDVEVRGVVEALALRRVVGGAEAGEFLGCSERQFRRCRRRYEEDGLEELVDQRLGKASARRIAVDEVMWMLDK